MSHIRKENVLVCWKWPNNLQFCLMRERNIKKAVIWKGKSVVNMVQYFTSDRGGPTCSSMPTGDALKGNLTLYLPSVKSWKFNNVRVICFTCHDTPTHHKHSSIMYTGVVSFNRTFDLEMKCRAENLFSCSRWSGRGKKCCTRKELQFWSHDIIFGKPPPVLYFWLVPLFVAVAGTI